MAYEDLGPRAVEAVRGTVGRKREKFERDNALGLEQTLCRMEGNW